MAHLLGGESLHLEFPTKVVFDSVSLGVDEGDRIGIVGRNGDGKSSLLAMLAGRLEPDAGRVTVRGGVWGFAKRTVRCALIGARTRKRRRSMRTRVLVGWFGARAVEVRRSADPMGVPFQALTTAPRRIPACQAGPPRWTHVATTSPP